MQKKSNDYFFIFFLFSFDLLFRLNLYVYEYLYHIGASKAAQGFCADVRFCFKI
jgi:hypothetical protein